MLSSNLSYPAKRLAGVAAAAICLCSFHPRDVAAAVYVHRSPLTLNWEAASGQVVHYHVYASVDGQPSAFLLETQTASCSLGVQDNHRYVIQVEAEGQGGLTGPRSDPSEEIVVFLNGSETDTDGDGMANTWETTYGLDAYNPGDANQDLDADGLLNREEYLKGSSPTDTDSDDDGVGDGLEVSRNQNPTDAADNRPVARAGNDSERDPTQVTLNGTGSYDPNQDPLTYSWNQLEGPAVSLSNPSVSSPTFLGRASGPHRFRLVVNDGKVSSSPDEVTITIRNVAPTAEAGSDQVVDAGGTVLLDAVGSLDPNGDSLTYSWSQTQGSAVTLEGAGTRTARFTPYAAGLYGFRLVVSDGVNVSAPDTTNVVVNAVNHVPTANAGPDQLTAVSRGTRLDGSGSADPDGDALSYSWRQLEGPAPVFLAYPQAGPQVNPSFSPPQAGTYVFELTVNDGKVSSNPDTVNVIAEDENRAPTAQIAAVNPVVVGTRVELNGQGSIDPDGDALNYQWSQTGGPAVSLESEQTATTAFYAVTEGVLTFELVVDDGVLLSAPALVQVTVNGANRVPVANAGKDFFGLWNKVNVLDGSASYDPDTGDTLSYQWGQRYGTKVTLQGANTAGPSFTPTSKGIYVFDLRVSDGKLQSTTDTVMVIVWW